jgi:hypothetical protein
VVEAEASVVVVVEWVVVAGVSGCCEVGCRAVLAALLRCGLGYSACRWLLLSPC